MKAFTLVELLITITIFGVVSSFVVPVTISQLQATDAENSTKVVANDVYEAQQNAYYKKYSVEPNNILYQTNFDSLTTGALASQDNWVNPGTSCTGTVCTGSTGNWTVQASGSGKNINQASTDVNQMNNGIYQTSVFAANVTVSVDFQVLLGAVAVPEVWVRRTTLDSSFNSYEFLYYNNSFYFNYRTTNLASVAVSDSKFVAGAWYTAQFQIYNDPNGNPILNGWYYPQGTAPPISPSLTFTDTNKYVTSAGYTGLSTYSTAANYDNYKIAANNNSLSTCYGINFSNLVTLRQYQTFSGIWSDSTGCTSRSLITKNLPGNSSVTSSYSSIIFAPGNVRPIPYTSTGSATATSSSNTITALTTFNPTISVGDNISFSTSQSKIARILSVTSNTSIVTDLNLGNVTNTYLNKGQDIILTINDATINYTITITNEGQISFNRIS